ncbi:MAG: hypothetical protein BGO70_18455 [Bacteroidetes bacterium 43-93]|nr:MAG: hypothetical protein BGO70_18455 [Bacteroidetes bacterium 43-93]
MAQIDNLTEHLKVLNQIGASILSELTVEEIVETVYHHVNQLMDAYSFAIGVYNINSGYFDYVGARENGVKVPPFSIYAHNSERFSGWVFANKKEVLINDFENEYHIYLPERITALQGHEPASLMYVPLLVHKEIIGMLSVRTPAKNAYTHQSLETLKTLAVFISKAIENSRINGAGMPAIKIPKSYHLDPLSARELDVLNLLSKGFTNRAIADELYISASTVKTHTLNIYMKLEAGNRTEAIFKAKQYGILK